VHKLHIVHIEHSGDTRMKIDVHQLRQPSLHCSWTWCLEQSANGPQKAGLDIQMLCRRSLKT